MTPASTPRTSSPGSRFRAVSVLAVWLAAAAAHADCLTREPSAEERQFVERLRAALLAAMPAAPENMVLPAAPRAEPRSSFCQDTPAGEVSVAARAIYRWQAPKAEAERIDNERHRVEGELKALQALPEERQREFDAWALKSREAFAEARRAEKAGDKALASQKYREASAFDAEANAVRKRHLDSVKAQTDALEAQRSALPRTSGDFEVTLTANGHGMKPRRHEDELKLGAVPPPRGKGFKVHGLQAIVAGPESNGDQRRALIAAFDRERLRAIIERPLPESAPEPAWSVGRPQPEGPAVSGGASPPANAPPAAGGEPSAAKAPDALEQAKDALKKLPGLFKP